MRYYFHFENDNTHLDVYGIELECLADAKSEAIRVSSELLAECGNNSAWTGKPVRIWVTDQPSGKGRTLFSMLLTATESA